LAYIDDIVVYSNDIWDHLKHLRQVVELHVQCGMKLNLRKCHVLKTEIEYLGHLVSRDGIRMIPSYVQRILDWPLPTTGKELRQFLGFTGYYRSFVKEYSYLTAEMNKLKNDQTVSWTDSVIHKFDKLKECFKQEPLRGYPQYDTDQAFILDTDFSSTNLAAVLNQRQQGKEVFLGCVAKKCNKAEANYPSHKGEMAAVILGLKRFEHILRAKPFIIRTDSKCVQYLQTMKEYRGIWARWQAYLASFNFQTVHRSGTLQCTADALSRMPGLEDSADADALEPDEFLQDIDDIYAVVSEVTLADLQLATESDSVLRIMKGYVLDKHKPDKEERKTLSSRGMALVNVFECLQVEDGVLYFVPPKVNGVQKDKRICLPLSLLDNAFKLCHDDPTAGHYGLNKTYFKLREKFYFPHLYSYVSGRIHNCVPCISKQSTMPKPTHNQHVEELSYPGQRLYVDTVGPLTPSHFQGKMCKHFITMQDGFTRYLVASPIESVDASTVSEAVIERWVYVHGTPEVVHSDQGVAFTSKLFKEIMERLHIVNTTTPGYSPEANRVERAHRVLGGLLRADRRFEAKAWPNKLLAAVLAYNTTINRCTGLSPFEAMYGRPPRLPIELAFPFPRKEGVSFSTQIEDMKLKFHQIFEQITEKQRTGIMLDHFRFQARSKPEFHVGDIVYFFLGRIKPGLSKKLQSRWIGPFKVKRIVSDSLLVIFPEGDWTVKPMEISTIVSRLKKVDPTLTLKELRPSKRHQIDLEVILDDLDELSEYLAYQRDFEDDDEVEDQVLPPLTLSGPMGPGVGGQPLEDPPPDEGMIPSDVVEPSPSIGAPSRNARIGSETSLDPPPRRILPTVKSEPPPPHSINDDEVEFEASVEAGRGQPPEDADSEDEYTSPLNMSWRTDEDSQTDGSEPSLSPARGQRPSLQLEGASRMTFASARAKIAQQLQPKRKRKK